MKKIFLLLSIALFFSCSDEENKPDEPEVSNDHSYYQMLLGEWAQDHFTGGIPTAVTFYADSFMSSDRNPSKRYKYSFVNWRYNEELGAWVADRLIIDNSIDYPSNNEYSIEFYGDYMYLDGYSSKKYPLKKK